MTAILCPSSLGCKSRHCLLNGIIVTPTVIPCQAQFHTKSGRNCRRLCMKRCTDRLPNAGSPCYTESRSPTDNRKERTTMTIGDKCPYCGRELLSGYLQSARQIIWSQEEKSISFRADEDGDLVVSHGIWEGSCRLPVLCRLRHLPAGAPRAAAEIRRAPAREIRPPARRRHNGIRKDRTRRFAACGSSFSRKIRR